MLCTVVVNHASAGGSDDTRSYIINAIPVAGAAMETIAVKAIGS